MLTTGFWVSQAFTPWLASCCSITSCGDNVKWPLLSGTSDKKQGGGGTNAVHTHTQPLPVDVRTETTKKGKNKETLQLTKEGMVPYIDRFYTVHCILCPTRNRWNWKQVGWIQVSIIQVAHYTRKVRIITVISLRPARWLTPLNSQANTRRQVKQLPSGHVSPHKPVMCRALG